MYRTSYLVVALTLSAEAFAGQLVPKKASDLRTVSGNTSSGTPCPGIATMKAVDGVSGPDGTGSALSIAPGTIFVVTSFDWRALGVPAGQSGTAFLMISNGTAAAFAARGSASADATGAAFGVVEAPPGVAVKSGATLCVGASNATGADVIAHGFITKDN